MKKVLSLVKSSLHDIRCCDETGGGLTAFRALTSSISCVLNASGIATGYAHVGTLEQYTISTGVTTGVTKSNLSTDTDYIRDYIDTGMCPAAGGGTTLATIYNGNVVPMTVTLTDIANPDIDYIFTIPALTGQTFTIANASYHVDLVVLNNDGTNVLFVANDVERVVGDGLPARITPVSTPINISASFTDLPLT